MTDKQAILDLIERAWDHVRYELEIFVHHIAMMIPINHDIPLEENRLFMKMIDFCGLLYGATSKQKWLRVTRENRARIRARLEDKG